MDGGAMNTSMTSHPHRRRAGFGAVLAAAATLSALGIAGPADATDEFPSAPTATAEFECNPGPFVTLHLGNLQGLSPAHFDVSQTGKADDAYDVGTGSSTLVARFGAPEDETTTITVTGPNQFSYTASWPVNCYDTDGVITLTCEGEQPVITADVEQVGPDADYVDLLGVEGGTVSSKAEGPSTVLTGTVADGVAFSVSVQSQFDQETVATLEGTPHCTPDPTTTTTSTTAMPGATTSTSAVAPSGPSTTEPVPVLQQQATPPPAGPVVASGELARTGSATLPLTLTGLTLLGLGIALRRFSLRRA